MLKKRKVAIALLLFFLLCLAGCSGAGDWKASGLPGGYEVWRINSRMILLCMPEPDKEFMVKTVVPGYVFEVAYNDAFICAKRAEVPDDLDVKIDVSDPDYYIVDVAEGICHGPMEQAEFDAFCQAHEELTDIRWQDMKTLRRNLEKRK